MILNFAGFEINYYYYLCLLLGIFNGDFQHKNCSVVFPLDRLPVIRVVCSYLKTNFSRSRIFRISCRSQDTFCYLYQAILTCLAEVESRTQGSRPRPRTQKNPRPKTALPKTDPLKAKDQGHRRKCSPKNKVFKKIFMRFTKFLQFKNRVVIEPRAGQFSSTGGFKHQGQGL